MKNHVNAMKDYFGPKIFSRKFVGSFKFQVKSSWFSSIRQYLSEATGKKWVSRSIEHPAKFGKWNIQRA